MRILCVSVMRNEGPHLLEWLAHHRALGVSDFLIYTNDCEDGTDTMLRALAGFGVVQRENPATGKQSLQWQALKAAWRDPLRRGADWVIGIDCDEFVALAPPLETLADLIARMPEADAIALPWRLFGHNGQRLLQDAPTCAIFTRAAPRDLAYPASARAIKTLFRARGPFRQMGVHRPRNKPGAVPRWVSSAGQAMPGDFAQNDERILDFAQNHTAKLAILNHYSVRSAMSFMLKRHRGLPNRKAKQIDLMYWVERNFNTVAADEIARHAAPARAELARLYAVPGMGDLHRAAHAKHHALFDAMMREEDALRLYGRLLLAADSTPLDARVTDDLIRRFRARQSAAS
ncbi:MAG: glycosyltransferase family 2 protein [Pseudomonadota bacterium]